MPQAKNLLDAISVFDHRQPLHGQALADFYVARSGNPLKLMQIQLQALALRGNQPVTFLLSGHRGSGKSTELGKLAEELKNRFFVVRVDLVNFAPSVLTLTYQDVLLGMALALQRRASERDVIGQSPAEWAQNIGGRVLSFLSEKLAGPIAGPPPVQPEEIAAKINAGVAELELKYKLTPSTRNELARYVEENLPELHHQMNALTRQVQERVGRPVLFVIENTDKPDISRAREIFRDHANAVTGFEASAIYTFPVGLVYSVEFNQFKTLYTEHFTLPNLRLTNRQGNPDPDGSDSLREIVTRRLADDRIAPGALAALVAHSGGLVMSLIRMARAAAVRAVARDPEADKIGEADVEAAIAQERADFVRQLRPEDYPILAARHADKELSSQPEVQQLLHGLALLEYDGDGPWCDVNPVILPLIKERLEPNPAAR